MTEESEHTFQRGDQDAAQLRRRLERLEKEYRDLNAEHARSERALQAMDTVNKIIAPATDLDDMLDRVLAEILDIFGCDRAWLLYPCDPDAATWHVPKERTRPQWPGALAEGVEVPMDEFSASVMGVAVNSADVIRFDSQINPFSEFKGVQARFHIRSQLVMAIHPKIDKPWLMGIHHCEEIQTYTDADCDLFEALCGRVGDGLSSLLHNRRAIDVERSLNAELETRLKELEVIQEKAEAANRAKSEFLSSMSHELRTPLNAIIGFSDMIKHEVHGSVQPVSYQGYANDINTSGNHLLALINKVLDMSRIEAGEYTIYIEELELTELINEVFDMLRSRADEGSVSLDVKILADTTRVNADRLTTKQILINLLTNAIKFTQEGGAATVCVSRSVSEVIVEVIDDGIGMSVEEVERALEPFVQIEREKGRHHEGTGLGLALVKNFAGLQGGGFSLESGEGKGTKATFTMPVADTDSSAVAEPSSNDAGESMVWLSSMSVGVEKWDSDHRTLLDLILTLQGSVEKGDAPKNAGTIFDALVKYVEIHLSSEEYVMEQARYPGRVDHKASHDRFRTWLESLRENPDSPPGQWDGAEVADKLLNWWRDHVLTTDMAYKDFFDSQRGKVVNLLVDYQGIATRQGK